MAKVIPLTKGASAIVDDEDFDYLVSLGSWHLSSNGYAVRRGMKNGKRVTTRMHRVVNKTPEGYVTDHKNHNRLDNRKSNLRTATQKDNMSNYKGEKGYCWDKVKQKWLVRYKNKFYGRYDTEEEAKQAYKLAKSGVEYPKRKHRQNYHLPKGVFKNKSNHGYQARIQKLGRRIYLGTFNTIEQAHEAYEKERVTS
jgi:hypothetical protein